MQLYRVQLYLYAYRAYRTLVQHIFDVRSKASYTYGALYLYLTLLKGLPQEILLVELYVVVGLVSMCRYTTSSSDLHIAPTSLGCLTENGQTLD
jgi:hypothetical protein